MIIAFVENYYMVKQLLFNKDSPKYGLIGVEKAKQFGLDETNVAGVEKIVHKIAASLSNKNMKQSTE